MSSISEKENTMAENHDNHGYGEVATVSSVSDASLETRRTSVSPTSQVVDLLLRNILSMLDRRRIKWWQVALFVAIVAFILYIAHAWWQWQNKGNAVVMQLLRRKDNETAHDILAASDLIFQGERIFYMIIIIILLICVFLWVGWKITSQSRMADAAKRVENEKAQTHAAMEELQAVKADIERLEEEVRRLEQQLTGERHAKEREISDKQHLESTLAETQEQRDDCQKRIDELELTKEQMKAELNEEISLRQQANEALQAEKQKHRQEIKELKSKWWWGR